MTKKISSISAVIMVLSILSSPSLALAKSPTVSTLSASAITESSATLNGYLNPNGTKSSAWFEFNSKKYGLKEAITGKSPVSLSYSLTGLKPNTSYSFRIVAKNADGTVSGKTESFKTKEAPKAETSQKTSTSSTATSSTTPVAPIVNPLYASTGMVYNIKSSSATVSGNWKDESTGATTWFEYGTTMSLGRTTTKAVQKSKVDLALANINGLSSNTTYYYRFVSQNSIGKVEGLIYSFRTLSGSGFTEQRTNILASTNSASTVGTTRATLNGFIDLKNSSGSYWFEWGENSSLISRMTPTVKLATKGTSLANATITDLEPGTTYYFRVVGQSDSYGIARGETFAFETSGKSYLAKQTASVLNEEFNDKTSIIWIAGLALFFFLVSFALSRFWA